MVCRVLTQHGCTIAPSTFYGAFRRAPSARAPRDEQLKAVTIPFHVENYGVYGRGRSGCSSAVRARRWSGGAADARAEPGRCTRRGTRVRTTVPNPAASVGSRPGAATVQPGHARTGSGWRRQ